MNARYDEYGYGREGDWDRPSHDGGDARNYSRDRYGSAGRQGQIPAQAPSYEHYVDEAAQYSRYNAGINAANTSAQSRYNTMYSDLARTKRKRSLGRRILTVVGCLLLACVLAGGAYAIWFTHALDSALASDDDSFANLDEVLVPVTKGKPYYVLIMGSDSREGNYSAATDQQGDNERSDVMMLGRVDDKNKQVTLLSIPRDTPYQLADGSYIKINQMYNYEGAAGAVKAVSELTGVPISHHASVRVSGLENIVNALGGVTVDVPVDLSYITMDDKEVTIKAGRQTLNGQEAQIFARARHEFGDNQDQHRQSNVRQLLTAIINKILDRPLPEIPGLVLQLAEYIDTDMRSLDAAGIAMAFAGGKTTVYTGSGPSEGAVDEQGGGKWLCYLNPEGWQKIMALVDAGEKPEGVDFAETQIPWTEITDQPDFNSSLAHHYYYGTHLDANGEWVYGKIENSVDALNANVSTGAEGAAEEAVYEEGVEEGSEAPAEEYSEEG